MKHNATNNLWVREHEKQATVYGLQWLDTKRQDGVVVKECGKHADEAIRLEGKIKGRGEWPVLCRAVLWIKS